MEIPVISTAPIPVASRALPNWLYCLWARASLWFHSFKRVRYSSIGDTTSVYSVSVREL